MYFRMKTYNFLSLEKCVSIAIPIFWHSYYPMLVPFDKPRTKPRVLLCHLIFWGKMAVFGYSVWLISNNFFRVFTIRRNVSCKFQLPISHCLYKSWLQMEVVIINVTSSLLIKWVWFYNILIFIGWFNGNVTQIINSFKNYN